MYNDFKGTLRDSWRFTYSGSELAPYAEKKLAEHKAAEWAAREQIATLMRDPEVNQQSNNKLAEAKREVAEHGDGVEKCGVWVHEFRKRPNSDFLLSLGDVVYFGLIDPLTELPAAG